MGLARAHTQIMMEMRAGTSSSSSLVHSPRMMAGLGNGRRAVHKRYQPMHRASRMAPLYHQHRPTKRHINTNAQAPAKSVSSSSPSSSSHDNSLLSPFHLAIPVFDLEESRAFYKTVLGCSEGRSANTWVDFNLFGHQLVCHVIPTPKNENGNGSGKRQGIHLNAVDGDAVPVP